jgi:hypothetical protein
MGRTQWSFDRMIAVTGAALSFTALAAVIYFGLRPQGGDIALRSWG